MRCALHLIIIATISVVATHAFIINPPKYNTVATKVPANKTPGWIHKQKLVLTLFKDLSQPSTDVMINRLAENCNFENATEKFKFPNVVEEWNAIMKSQDGFLTRNDDFSEFDENHFSQFTVLTRLMYSSVNFDNFLTVASWARQNVNADLYVAALYAAVMKRSDCQDLYIPPPYEVLPYNFVTSEVFDKLDTIITMKALPDADTAHIEANEVIVDMNYTAPFFNNDDESRLTYFREDVGLNSYYYLNRLKVAPWIAELDSNKSDFGKWWYFFNQQLNARYNLERISNGLETETPLKYDETIHVYYDPKLYGRDMNPLLQRNYELDLQNCPLLSTLIASENELLKCQMSQINETVAMNYLVMQTTVSRNNFEANAHKVLGHCGASSSGCSVLDHYMTSLRDPLFWKLNRNIVKTWTSYMNSLPSYTKKELYFPGVLINNIELKKLQTYYEYFTMDVIPPSDATNNLALRVGQPRLQNKPFSVLINITSSIPQKAVIKLFIGPKSADNGLAGYNYDLNERKTNFFLIDSFQYGLKAGENTIVRKSIDIKKLSPDFASMRSIFKTLELMEEGLPGVADASKINSSGFPQRLVIPKGTAEGFPFQLFMIAAPFIKKTVVDGAVRTVFNEEALSFGFPFDRHITDVGLFNFPNIIFKDTLVYHKGDNKVVSYGANGITKNWFYTEPYVYNPEQSFDYKSKKENTVQLPGANSQIDLNKPNMLNGEDGLTLRPLLMKSKDPLSKMEKKMEKKTKKDKYVDTKVEDIEDIPMHSTFEDWFSNLENDAPEIKAKNKQMDQSEENLLQFTKNVNVKPNVIIDYNDNATSKSIQVIKNDTVGAPFYKNIEIPTYEPEVIVESQKLNVEPNVVPDFNYNDSIAKLIQVIQNDRDSVAPVTPKFNLPINDSSIKQDESTNNFPILRSFFGIPNFKPNITIETTEDGSSQIKIQFKQDNMPFKPNFSKEVEIPSFKPKIEMNFDDLSTTEKVKLLAKTKYDNSKPELFGYTTVKEKKAHKEMTEENTKMQEKELGSKPQSSQYGSKIADNMNKEMDYDNYNGYDNRNDYTYYPDYRIFE